MVDSTSATDADSGYSIRVASRLSGVTVDQLRVWERRYGFPKPRRDSAGNRVYDSADVQRLALIARAIEAGYRTSEAIAASDEEIERTLQLKSQGTPSTSSVEGILGCLREGNLAGVADMLRSQAAALGARRYVSEYVSLLLQRTGDAWASGSLDVMHEHLLAEAISTRNRALLATYRDEGPGPKVLLAAPPSERHGLGLEMVALYLAASGATPYLLGPDSPLEQIDRAVRQLRVDAVGISVSAAFSASHAQILVTDLLVRLPQAVALWLGGHRSGDLRFNDPRVQLVPDFSSLDRALLALRQ